MEPADRPPQMPGAAAALAREALLQAAPASGAAPRGTDAAFEALQPTTQPPGSAAALAHDALQQAAAPLAPGAAAAHAREALAAPTTQPGTAAALAREALATSAQPGAAAASARALQKARATPSAPLLPRSPLPPLPPLQQHWPPRPPQIIDFDDDEDDEDDDRRCCCCCRRGHQPDDVFSRKWLKRLCFLHIVLGFALFWLLALAVVLFPNTTTFGEVAGLPFRVAARCLACGLVALTALRVPLDARELNATLPKAAAAKVLDVVASSFVWAALVPAFVRTYVAAAAKDQSAWMVGLLCFVSFVTDVAGVCVAWVAVTPLCCGELLPIAAREEALDGEYYDDDADREDIIVEIGSLLATPRGGATEMV